METWKGGEMEAEQLPDSAVTEVCVCVWGALREPEGL